MNSSALARAATAFQAAFGQMPSLRVRPPGRVNLVYRAAAGAVVVQA